MASSAKLESPSKTPTTFLAVDYFIALVGRRFQNRREAVSLESICAFLRDLNAKPRDRQVGGEYVERGSEGLLIREINVACMQER